MVLTKAFLRLQQNTMDLNQQNRQKTVNENLALFRKSGDCYDLFISHSYKDKELIQVLVSLFNQANYSVYVDWIEDYELDRSNVTEKTAKRIREKMESCKGLAFISTEHITDSKWCPWELGFADGHLKGRACILPIMNENVEFHGREFLGIYPYIDYAQIKGKENFQFWVTDSNISSRYATLRDWLDGKEMISR